MTYEQRLRDQAHREMVAEKYGWKKLGRLRVAFHLHRARVWSCWRFNLTAKRLGSLEAYVGFLGGFQVEWWLDERETERP